MENVATFLTNNIIVIWVAPIITGLILAIILKFFSISKSKKEIKRANLEYKNAILPYVLQKINLGEQVLHAIRDAIAKETGIPNKHLYSDHELMNMLIFDITKTRFSTEDGKKDLIDHICDMFSFNKDKNEETEKRREKHPKKFIIILSTCIGIFSIVCMLVTYIYDPQALNESEGVSEILFFLLLIISIISFSFAFFSMSDTSDFYNRGFTTTILEAELSVIESIFAIIFGKSRQKKRRIEENNDNNDTKD